MYTIVVCSNCRHTWIAKDRPKRSMCRKCRKTRQWKKLKKYHKTDDFEEARTARAFFQAKINENEDHFERAFDKGFIHDEVGEVIEQSEYLDGLGFDSGVVKSESDRLLESPDVNKSHRKVIDEWIADPENPTIGGFLDYIEHQDIGEQKALASLEALVQSGQVELPGEMILGDVQAKIDDNLDADIGESVGEQQSAVRNSSQKQVILDVVRDDSYDTGTEIVTELENRGFAREDVLEKLKGLAQSGEITALTLIEIEHLESKLESTTGSSDGENSGKKEENDEENDQPKRTGSYREILEGAFKELDKPTESDVLKYATEHGMARGKAEKHLQKYEHIGEVTKSTDGVLRML